MSAMIDAARGRAPCARGSDPGSAPRRVVKHLPPDEAQWRLKRRFAIINFWRPIGGPVLQTPLAVCDARTIEPADLMVSDLVCPDWTGET